MKYVCVSGNRADRAALTPVAEAMDAEWIFVDTSPSRDRFDSAISCGQATMVAAEQLEKLKPDLVILAGDRFEILGAATAAYLMGIPIAHLSGGDVTEGSQDDAMRHAITKLATLHFPTNSESSDRLLALGEEKWRIHMVGAPQIDYLLSQKLKSRENTLSWLGFSDMSTKYILVAYQPPTMLADPASEIDELLQILDKTQLPCRFTTVNPDSGREEITQKIIRFCQGGQHSIVSMNSEVFLSAMKHCEYMIGNSSAGYYEAPTLGTKFVAIGDRQRGRRAIRGDGKASERIKATLDAMMLVPKQVLLQKQWSPECPSTQPGNGSTMSASGAATPKRNWFAGPLFVKTRSDGSLTLVQGKDLPPGSSPGRDLYRLP